MQLVQPQWIPFLPLLRQHLSFVHLPPLHLLPNRPQTAYFTAIDPIPGNPKAQDRPRPSMKQVLSAYLLCPVPSTHRPSTHRDRNEVLNFPNAQLKWPPSTKLGENVTGALLRPTIYVLDLVLLPLKSALAKPRIWPPSSAVPTLYRKL